MYHTGAALHIQLEMDAIENEIHNLDDSYGIDQSIRCTGKVQMFRGAAWFEIKDGHNTRSWTSRSFPQHAAHGESLVYADSEEIFSDFE